ncbi:Nudix hydrolase 18, mitochondrial [Zostera marina]|uniref:Nudix hydrolase 18, mitochondrial n=1 Tax=Zostera marina TaxID=29655 RepID=A0A0K9Q0Z8_ZOSMR|nr:Nudix hydrolase 18, mitochondrial [Zostera marina]
MVDLLTSRQGRENQRYSQETGGRLVVGCVPYRLKNGAIGAASISDIDQLEILIISSQKPKERYFLFPKGGWENDETKKEAACREALEEAGIYGKIMGKRLGKWKYRKIEKGGVFNEGTMFAMYVTGELTHWPEIRKRIWVSVAEAKQACSLDWMREALDNLVQRLLLFPPETMKVE